MPAQQSVTDGLPPPRTGCLSWYETIPMRGCTWRDPQTARQSSRATFSVPEEGHAARCPYAWTFRKSVWAYILKYPHTSNSLSDSDICPDRGSQRKCGIVSVLGLNCWELFRPTIAVVTLDQRV